MVLCSILIAIARLVAIPAQEHPVRPLVTVSTTLIIALFAASQCRGDDQPSKRLYFVLHPHAKGTPSPGKPRCIPHTDDRAGFPRSLSHHAEASATSGGIGYHVGGGVPLGHGPGHPRYPYEGTWGWDETGHHFLRRRAILGWSHGRKYQGGTGAYRVDGYPIPDVIAGFHAKLTSLHSKDAE
jgi:hypothetical protein